MSNPKNVPPEREGQICRIGRRRVKRPDLERQKYEPKKNNVGGHKRVRLKREDFEKLAQLQCTIKEIAWWFGTTETVIQKRLSEEPYKTIWERGQADGMISIRRAQFEAVQDPKNRGHSAMLVWLGKIHLGQKETTEINVNQQENVARGPYQHPFVTEEEAVTSEPETAQDEVKLH